MTGNYLKHLFVRSSMGQILSSEKSQEDIEMNAVDVAISRKDMRTYSAVLAKISESEPSQDHPRRFEAYRPGASPKHNKKLYLSFFAAPAFAGVAYAIASGINAQLNKTGIAAFEMCKADRCSELGHATWTAYKWQDGAPYATGQVSGNLTADCFANFAGGYPPDYQSINYNLNCVVFDSGKARTENLTAMGSSLAFGAILAGTVVFMHHKSVVEKRANLVINDTHHMLFPDLHASLSQGSIAASLKEELSQKSEALVLAAVKRNDGKFIEDVLSFNRCILQKTLNPQDLFTTAIEFGRDEIFSHFLKQGFKGTSHDLYAAAKKADVKKFIQILSASSDQQKTILTDGLKDDALHYFSAAETLESPGIGGVLRALGGDATRFVNYADSLGRTALHFSMYWGRESQTMDLLQAGASPHIIDKFGRTPGQLTR